MYYIPKDLILKAPPRGAFRVRMLQLYTSREPFLKEIDPLPRFARQKRNLTLGRAKREGVGGKEFLPALALDADGICASVSWRAASFSNFFTCLFRLFYNRIDNL